MGTFFIAIIIIISIITICLENIRTELKYHNTLLKEQNEILKQNSGSDK